MPQHQGENNFKEFLNTSRGRFCLILVVAILLVLAAVIPAMLPKGASGDDKALARSLVKLANSDNKSLAGTVNFKAGVINGSVDLNFASKADESSQGQLHAKVNVASNTFDVPASFVIDQKNKMRYLKVSNLQHVIDVILDPKAAATANLNDISSKIEGRWLRMSADDTSAMTTDSEPDKCTPQLFERLQHDSSAVDSIASLIASDKLLKLEKVASVKDGKEYQLSVNADGLKDAFKEFKKTDLFKGASECKDSYDPFKIEAAEKASQQQPQAQQQQQPEASGTSTLKLTLNGEGNVNRFVYDSTNSQRTLNANISIDQKKPVVVTTPHDNIVDYSTISGSVKNVFKLLTTPSDARTSPNNVVSPYAGMQ